MTILIVEDDRIIREILCTIFGKLKGISRVLSTFDSDDALKQFRENQIELVITDYSLGWCMDGIELTIELKKINPSITIFMYCGSNVRVEALKSGVSKFLTKGGGTDSLVAAVQEFMKS